MSKVLGAVVQAALNFLMELISRVIRLFVKNKENEAENQANRERLENSETEQEQQNATNDLAGRLGRRK